jgi:uncharacterized protein YjiS (DUF1127 family)
MKFLNLAIASIIDANTGNGINQQFVNQYGLNHSDYAQHGRTIRASFLLALIARIRAAAKQYFENSKAAALARRNTREVLQMNEHLLNDIGLMHNDIVDLRLGLISLDTLSSRRNQLRSEQDSRLNRLSQNRAYAGAADFVSANQETYELKKCA